MLSGRGLAGGVLTALLGVPVAAAVLPLEGSGIPPRPDDPPRTTDAPTTTVAPTTTTACAHHDRRPGAVPPDRDRGGERRPGTTAWAVPQDPHVLGPRPGATRTAPASPPVSPSTCTYQPPAAHYEAIAYRMGHYGGAGGPSVALRLAPGLRAGTRLHRPRHQHAAGPLEGVAPRAARPRTWVPGSYLLKLTSSDGGR